MGGMVGRHMAEAVGNSSSQIAAMMTKSAAVDEAAAERHRYRMEELQQQAADRKDLKSMGKAGGESADLSDDQINEIASLNAAGKDGKPLFSSAADVAKLRTANSTGDYSGYQQTNEYDVPDADGNVGKVKVTGYPPGFDDQVAAKKQALGQIVESIRMGKDYKPIMEGRQTGQQMGLVGDVMAGRSDAADVGRAVAASKGEGSFTANDGSVVDKFSGEAGTTEVGDARIKEFGAQSAKLSADINKINAEIEAGVGKAGVQERVTTTLEKANSMVKGLSDEGRPKDLKRAAAWDKRMEVAVDLQTRAAAILRDGLAGKGAKGDPDATPAPEKKPSENPGKPSNARARYPDGTRLNGPGGKKFIVKNGVPVPE